MPKQNYFDPPEELAMSDYGVAGVYTDQCCLKDNRYQYPTYCLDCERDVPRRRCLSESSEPYRKRGREMMSLSPRKYECRSRTNLCELPTSYIANNCPPSQSNADDNYDCVSLKARMPAGNGASVKQLVTDENNKMSLYLDSFEDMDDPYKTWSGLYKYTPLESKNFSGLNSNIQHSPQKPCHILEPRKHISQKTKATGSGTGCLKHPEDYHVDRSKMCLRSKSEGPQHMGDMHFREPSPQSDYEHLHASFFNKKLDTGLIKERYEKEVEVLRAKLRELKSSAHNKTATTDHHNETVGPFQSHLPNEIKTGSNNGRLKEVATGKSPNDSLPKNGSAANCGLFLSPAADLKRSRFCNDVDSNHKSGKELSPSSIAAKKELIRQKSALKVSTMRPRSKLSAVKLRKVRNKITNSVSSDDSDFTESDCSDSENSMKESDGELEEAEIVNETNGNLCKPKPNISNYVPAKPSVESTDNASGDHLEWPIRLSLFPNIPPYIKFISHDSEVPFTLPSIGRFLKWKLSTITPIIVRKTLRNSGFRLVRKSNEWTGTWGKHMKSTGFKTLKDTQKLNHFPGTFQLGRKDRLWRNLQRLQNIYGTKEFGFIPHSYILPQDLKLLRHVWELKTGDDKWILKPPASARGTGIKVVHRWSQIPKRKSIVVQKYISDPFLINGSKFDLRLYVLVTSFNPLRIYIYPDGLVRFASVKYSDDISSLKDRYMHLTNYSINKLSSQYTANEDANACQGHKWTISKLWEYLEAQGIDTSIIWKNLKHLVTKTIISGESIITPLCNENMNSRYNCYELFGVDVLLDERLKAWLLEVNISPSLHSSSPLDAHVKGPLVENLLNMAQFHIPPRLSRDPNVPPCYDPKMYTTQLTKKEKLKHSYFTQVGERETYLHNILNELTGDDVRHLTQAEDELVVLGSFEKIFPTPTTWMYFQYMENRYYNRLFDAWEVKYERDRQPGIKLLQNLCIQKVHLRCPSPTAIMKSCPSTNPGDTDLTPSMEGQSFPNKATQVHNEEQLTAVDSM